MRNGTVRAASLSRGANPRAATITKGNVTATNVVPNSYLTAAGTSTFYNNVSVTGNEA